MLILDREHSGWRSCEMGCTLESIERLWDAVGEFDGVGFCLDTCHVGRRRGPRGAGRSGPRHHRPDRPGAPGTIRATSSTRGATGTPTCRRGIDADVLVGVIQAAQSPVVLETWPRGLRRILRTCARCYSSPTGD